MHIMRKRLVVAFIVAVAIALVASLSVKTEQRTQLKMATFVTITLQGPRWHDFDKPFTKAFAAIDEIEAILIYAHDFYYVVNKNKLFSLKVNEHYKVSNIGYRDPLFKEICFGLTVKESYYLNKKRSL